MLKVKGMMVFVFLMLSQMNLSADDAPALDHDDPKIRQKVLNTAIYVRSPIDKYKYYRMGIDNWQDDETKKEDLLSACNGLASHLYRRKKLTKKQQLLEGCPDEIHQKWLGTADREPQALIKIAPIYPSYAQRSNIEGWATTIFDIDKKGRTFNIRIQDSSSEYFHKAAIKATKKFVYLPARKDGELIESNGLTNKFNFSLK